MSKATPDNLAAVQLRAQARAGKDPAAGLTAVNEAAAAHPEHPGLQELLARTALGTGDLALARGALERLQPADDAPKAYRARVLALRGDLAAAGGDYAGAVEDYEASLDLAPNTEAVELARVRALMRANALTDAIVAVSEAVEAHPESVDAHLLQVEVDIASGKGDEALAKLGELATQIPDSAQVPFLVGQVHAMRLQTDEANAAFDQALARIRRCGGWRWPGPTCSRRPASSPRRWPRSRSPASWWATPETRLRIWPRCCWRRRGCCRPTSRPPRP